MLSLVSRSSPVADALMRFWVEDSMTREVIQLNIHMTESMTEIHGAILQCITSTLSELKRSNTSVSSNDRRSLTAVLLRMLNHGVVGNNVGGVMPSSS